MSQFTSLTFLAGATTNKGSSGASSLTLCLVLCFRHVRCFLPYLRAACPANPCHPQTPPRCPPAFALEQVMPLVEKVLDRSNAFVTPETKTALGTGARDLLAKIEGTVQGIDTKVRCGTVRSRAFRFVSFLARGFRACGRCAICVLCVCPESLEWHKESTGLAVAWSLRPSLLSPPPRPAPWRAWILLFI